MRRQLRAEGRERALVLRHAHAVEDDFRRHARAFAAHEPAPPGLRAFAKFAAIRHGLAGVAHALDGVVRPQPVVFDVRRRLPRTIAPVLNVPRVRNGHWNAVYRPVDEAAHDAAFSLAGVTGAGGHRHERRSCSKERNRADESRNRRLHFSPLSPRSGLSRTLEGSHAQARSGTRTP